VKDKLTSTAFWTTVAFALGAWLAAVVTTFPAEYAAIVSTASVVAYAISRGIAKYDADLKNGYKTTEFWIAVAQIVVVVLATVPGAVQDKVAGVLVATIAAVYTITRGMAAPPPDTI
jgi:uncharacterized membrane protein HdeD (DUF308 family)